MEIYHITGIFDLQIHNTGLPLCTTSGQLLLDIFTQHI